MTVEQAIRERLVADATVQATVSSRIYQLNLPQKSTFPAVRVQLIDSVPPYHLRGPAGVTTSRVQVDAFGAESAGYAAVATLADAIDDALSGDAFTVGSPAEIEITGAFRAMRRPLFESGELRLVRILQDYIVWSQAVN